MKKAFAVAAGTVITLTVALSGTAVATPAPATGPTTATAAAASASTPAEAAQARVKVPGPAVAAPPASDAAGPLAVPQAQGSAPAMYVVTSPDPTPSASGAYIYTSASLAAPPTVAVTGPDGATIRMQATAYVQAGWWTAAPLPGDEPGIHQVRASAPLAGESGDVTGRSSFEVVGPVQHRGGVAVVHGPSWQAMGPNSMGGLFAADPTDVTTLYVAEATDPGVWVSHNRGMTWQSERNLPVGAGYPTALVADPTDGKRLYLAVNGGDGFSVVADPTYNGKILRSDDGGQHWAATALPEVFVSGLAITPDGRTLAAVTRSGLYVSHDRGATWAQLPVPWGPTDYDSMSLVGNTLYIATFDGLFAVRDVSDDPQPPVAVWQPGGRSNWIRAVVGDSHTLYADSWAYGVYISHDDGATWTPSFDPDGLVWMMSETGGAVYVSAGGMLWRSADQGASWQAWHDPAPSAVDQTVVAIGATIYVSTFEAGLYTTKDGEHYTRVGVPGATIYGMAETAGPHGALAAATTWGVYAKARSGLNRRGTDAFDWYSPGLEGNLTAYVTAVGAAGSSLYRIWNQHSFFNNYLQVQSSGDAGHSWTTLDRVPGAGFQFYVDPADNKQLYVSCFCAGQPALLISRDAGATWTTVPAPDRFQVFAGAPRNADVLYASGPNGLWASTDGGLTWTQKQSVAYPALAVLPSGQLVLGGSMLGTSDDGGASVRTAMTPGLDISVRALLVDPRHADVVYAALGPFYEYGLYKGGRGVWRSTNGGRTWSPFADGLDNLNVISLAGSPDGKQLYAGTGDGGVYGINP